ncbi:MAG: HIT family protein [Planctomycetaceae bacterium]|nr:MAG: HIT family protein [Planctomycetaceae bacterium]
MGADDCLFCKMVAGKIPVTKIYEDEVVLSFLDIGPISNGHTLVIPKRHFEKLHECPAELLGKVFTRIGKIAGAVAAAMDSDGYNLLCNNGRAAGQLIEHLHFHIVPRNTGDRLFSRWPSFEYKDGKIEEIAGAIRKNL